MSNDFSTYRLRKWSRLARVRDLADGKCPMCARPVNIWLAQSHHIRPKSLYPELAYDLDNAISLCVRCHICVVHGEDTFKLGPWRFHVPNFDRHNGLAAQRRFNELKQPTI